MSSMSVVDNVQLVDVNKKTHPQDNSINHNYRDNDNEQSSLSSSNSDVMVQLTPSQQEELHEIYSHSHLPDNPVIDTEMYYTSKDSSVSNLESNDKLEQLKRFAEIFIPMYQFFKSITPDFSKPDFLNFNINFAPILGFVNSVTSFGTVVYESGKKIVSDACETIKNIGQDILDFSVDCGKKVCSFVSSIFSDDDSSPKPTNNEIDSNEIILRDVAKRNQVSSNENTSAPYWKGLDKINGPNPVVSAAKKFQNHFLALRNTKRLDSSFLFEGEHSILQINGQNVSKYSPAAMLDDFKEIIPDLESRQLISSFANQGILSQPYVELFAEHPELVNFKPKDSKFFYVVHEVEPGKFEFTATSQADLEVAYETPDHNKYNAFGVQASMVLSKEQAPKITYSYYLR